LDIRFETVPASGVTLITLTGRMDVAGAAEIDVRFSALTSGNRAVVVDMGGVEFMASMGLRTLIVAAKSVASKRGKMVLYRPAPMVREVIITSGVENLLPMTDDLADAEARVSP